MLLPFRVGIAAMVALLLSSSVTMAAGFNCKNKSRLTAVEIYICEDVDLNAADAEMSTGYQALMKVLPEAEAELLQNDQRLWLDERNEAVETCLSTPAECRALYTYAKRIAVLGNPKEASFNCKKASQRAESKICSSRLLRHADGKLAEIYKGFAADFKDAQLEWLQERNAQLGQADCGIECGWEVLKARIEFFVHQSF